MVKSAKLKVFQAPFGFYDSIVAAPSQTAALKAWGSHQNLFAEKIAFVVTDERDIAAAIAHPEMPLRRAIGSNKPFELEPSAAPKVPKLQKSKEQIKSIKPELRKPLPDRKELDKFEAALRNLDEQRKEEEAEFDRRLQALHAERAVAQHSYGDAKAAAKSAIETARHAYVKAGGEL
jgi:hypothetical protein